jgi:hypothetical protein
LLCVLAAILIYSYIVLSNIYFWFYERYVISG